MTLRCCCSALNSDDEVLLVDVDHICVLPGGSKRAIREDGAGPRIPRRNWSQHYRSSFIKEAKQYLRAIFDDRYYNKHFHFYLVEIDSEVGAVSASDHQPYWMMLGRARMNLTAGAQRWAFSQLRIEQ